MINPEAQSETRGEAKNRQFLLEFQSPPHPAFLQRRRRRHHRLRRPSDQNRRPCKIEKGRRKLKIEKDNEYRLHSTPITKQHTKESIVNFRHRFRWICRDWVLPSSIVPIAII